MKNKWKIVGLVFIIVLAALILTCVLFLAGEWLGYNTLGQKISIWLQSMLLICALLLTPTIITITRRIWAKDKAKQESLNPTEKQKAQQPKPFPEFDNIKKYCRHRYGFFWRHKVKKILVIGDGNQVSKILPELIAQRWLLGDKTVFIWGGEEQDSINEGWLRALKRCCGCLGWLRYRPLNAIVWVLSEHYLETSRKQRAQLDKSLSIIRERNRILKWDAPVYLVDSRNCVWEQEGRVEQSVGTLFPVLKTKTIESIGKSLHKLSLLCCQRGMQQVGKKVHHAFLLQLSQDLVKKDITRIKGYFSNLISIPKPPLVRGLFFVPFFNKKEGRESVALEHQLLMTPTWQSISDDAGKQRGRRIGFQWENTLCSITLGLILIAGIGIVSSYYQNQALIMNSQQLVNQIDEANHRDYVSQLQAQYALQLQIEQLLYRKQKGVPISYRFGLSQNDSLLNALWTHYYQANKNNIAKPFEKWLVTYLTRFTAMSPSDPNREKQTDLSYGMLKAYLMLGQTDKIDPVYLSQFADSTWEAPSDIKEGDWKKVMPELVAFWGKSVMIHPKWASSTDMSLIKDVRQILISQIGIKNAGNTIYQEILQRASQNYANLTLVQLLGDIDSRMLFTSTDEIQGVFTRKAWEKVIKSEIAQAAKSRQEQIDWVLSDGSQVMDVSASPDALRQYLTDRYFSDYGAAWLLFLNNISWRQADNIADVIEQLTLMSDVRQSPVIALMNVVKYQAEVAYSGGGLSDSLIQSAQNLIGDKDPAKLSSKIEASGPLTPTFGPVLNLLNTDIHNGLSLQTYLLRVTQVRLKLQNITSSADPQAMAQALAKSVFQGTSVDLTDTRDYGNLIAANLGEEWLGFGYSLFKQPLEQAWEVILTPAAHNFNKIWQNQVVYPWEKAFAGRYPFKESSNDASLADLARFLRPNAGVIDRFIASELGGVLEKQGDSWVMNPVNSQGLHFSPQFIETLNLFNELSNQLFISGDAQISFDLMARSGYNVVRAELIIDKQKLNYFNQMPQWQRFNWPGDEYEPYSQLTWSSDESGLHLYEHYSGDWAWIRLLESAFVRQIDSSRYEVLWRLPDERKLKYILRTQSGEGPLALLKLRNFSLSDKVFDN